MGLLDDCRDHSVPNGFHPNVEANGVRRHPYAAVRPNSEREDRGMSGHRQAPSRSGLLRLAVAVVLGVHEVAEGQRCDAQSFHVGHPTGGGSIWEDVSSFWSGTWNSRPNRCRSPWLVSKVSPGMSDKRAPTRRRCSAVSTAR